jgi:fatty acid desaturase
LRFKADRRPVIFVLAALALHVGVFLWASPAWAAVWVLPLAVVGMFVAPINHHHQHVNTFRSRPLNRAFELALSLQTGVSPYSWVLHHNFGHHQNYLNQPPHGSADESRWKYLDGTPMGRVAYTLNLFIRHPLDIYRVGKRQPKAWRNYLLMKLPMWGLLAAGLAISPWNCLFAFVLPAMLTLLHTCWATYEHHAGHEPTGHHDASVNRENALFNWLTCNLGLHTAHHTRPGLHWSLLPEYHAKIRDRIPEHQLLSGFW